MRRPRFWNDTSLLTNVLTPIGLVHNFISKQSYKLKKTILLKSPRNLHWQPYNWWWSKDPGRDSNTKIIVKKK